MQNRILHSSAKFMRGEKENANLIHFPADTDVPKTSSERLKKVATSYDQTRRPKDFWEKTSDIRRLEDVQFTSS